MTEEQAAWLKANPSHEPIGQLGGFSMYTKRGTLKPDGTFVPVTKGTPLETAGGCFGVGVKVDRREVAPANQPAPRPQGGGFQTAAAADKTAPAPLPDDADRGRLSQPPGPLPKKV